MEKLNFNKIAKQIIKENPGETQDYLAQQLYNSALSSPNLLSCKKMIKKELHESR